VVSLFHLLQLDIAPSQSFTAVYFPVVSVSYYLADAGWGFGLTLSQTRNDRPSIASVRKMDGRYAPEPVAMPYRAAVSLSESITFLAIEALTTVVTPHRLCVMNACSTLRSSTTGFLGICTLKSSRLYAP
jgi:hypothetical protein